MQAASPTLFMQPGNLLKAGEGNTNVAFKSEKKINFSKIYRLLDDSPLRFYGYFIGDITNHSQ